MANRYKVTPTKTEREQLTERTRSGKSPAAKFVYARALLLCNASECGDPWKVADVAAALGVTSRTMEHLKQRFVEEGLEMALARKAHRKPREDTFDGAFDARLTALACSKVPTGHQRWTRRQACRAKDCGLHLGHERATLSKRNELRPHLSSYWKIPPDNDAVLVAAMEEILDVYQLSHDPRFPVVCMDESSKQLVGEVHAPIPVAPGHGQLVDHEYVRHGMAMLFVEVEPLLGRHHVEVTERRTRQDWARFSKVMLAERYPHATKARPVMDNLNHPHHRLAL
jgi:hypothetical protein